MLCDAVIRLIPGVLGDETSTLSDSFQDDLISPPVYTRPREFNSWKVPDILLSGNENVVITNALRLVSISSTSTTLDSSISIGTVVSSGIAINSNACFCSSHKKEVIRYEM